MPTLEMRLFGNFQIRRDGQPIAQLPGRRIRELLCYLILKRDIPQSREHLAGLLWGNLDEGNARRCLSTALWRLRGMLGDSSSATRPYLRVDAHTICFSTDSNCWIDIVEMESHCALADHIGSEASVQRAALYRNAASLYLGELMVDCFEDWCLVERRHMEQQYLQALGHLAAFHADRGEFTAAIGYQQQITFVDPLREDAWRSIMNLHLLNGNPGAALRVYRKFEGVLRHDLGIPPMPETSALLSRILGHQQPVAAFVESGRKAAAVTSSANHHETAIAAALACLGSADVAFEVGRAQLGQAMTLMEGVQRELGISATTSLVSPSTGMLLSEHLGQAMMLLESTFTNSSD